MKTTKVLLATCLALCISHFSIAQLTLPPSGDNQKSEVAQYMGLVEVAVTYNSPDVTGPGGEDRKGKIWGQLVPYGFANLGFGESTADNPSPWRGGANENTIISFSHDVLVEGQPLKAGTYGLHFAPGEEEWVVIFSNNSSSWGSFFYRAEDDALRVTVAPNENNYNEWLTYTFSDRQLDRCTLSLQWENLQVPVEIKVENIHEIYLATIRDELRGQAGFLADNWANAANYCVQYNIILEEALTWADNAIGMPFFGREDFNTLQTRASVLYALGRVVESDETILKAVNHSSASPFLVHNVGRQMIAQGRKEKALEIFEANHKNYKAAWPTNVGMARGYSATGDFKKAIKYLKKGIENAPDELNSNYLKDALKKLQAGEDIN